MFQKNELMAELTRKSMTIKELAGKMGVNTATMSAKVNGKREFTRDEMERLSELLDLGEQQMMQIFFA